MQDPGDFRFRGRLKVEKCCGRGTECGESAEDLADKDFFGEEGGKAASK